MSPPHLARGRGLARRAARRAIGDVDRRVLPVLPISFLYNASFSTFWVYVGIFTVKGLGWRPGAVGILFLAAAPPAAVANYLSGWLSDRVGRKGPIVLSFVAATAAVLGIAAIGSVHAVAFALVVLLGVVGAPAYSLDRVLVADLIPEDERRESGYAAVRVAQNLGVFAGPPLAALLVAVSGWTAFLLAIAALGIVGAIVTASILPSTEVTKRPEPQRRGGIRLVLADQPFLLLLVSTLLGFFVYCGFETVLPVIAVSVYGIAPATWGLLVVISPLLVVALQLPLTRLTSVVAPAARLFVAMLLMGLPFLALVGRASTATVAAVIVVFVLGEMIWMPTSQGVAARLAPPAVRGTYFGALAAMTGPAWTLAPFIALELRAHTGVPAVWFFFAAVAVAGAAAGVAAIQAASMRPAGIEPATSRSGGARSIP
jgi:MFS family permease